MNNVIIKGHLKIALIVIGMLSTKLALAAPVPATLPAGCTPSSPGACVTTYVSNLVQPGYTLMDSPTNGYFGAPVPTTLVDLQGNAIKQWAFASFTKLLPNGNLLAGYFFQNPVFNIARLYMDCIVEQDWNGNVVWPPGAALTPIDPNNPNGPRFCVANSQMVSIGEKDPQGRDYTPLHHEIQRANNPVGYFAPNQEATPGSGKTMFMVNDFPGVVPAISDIPLYNDKIFEVDVTNNSTNILWSWDPIDHFNPSGPGDMGLGFNSIEKRAIRTIQVPVFGENDHKTESDWLHSNAVSHVGENRWCTNVAAASCDHRFDPDNVLWSSREANIIAIIARHDYQGPQGNWKSGAIVWRLGPDVTEIPVGQGSQLIGQHVPQLIGQHDPHIIPQGLPGAGNILVVDNGGAAGYGADANGNPARDIRSRSYSRVFEFNPVTMKVVWEYERPVPLTEQGEHYSFYSGFLGDAQRLPNGNTLIMEGNGNGGAGRAFEVTSSGQLVWEFINPYGPTYRAFRVPANWVPAVPLTK